MSFVFCLIPLLPRNVPGVSPAPSRNLPAPVAMEKGKFASPANRIPCPRPNILFVMNASNRRSNAVTAVGSILMNAAAAKPSPGIPASLPEDQKVALIGYRLSDRARAHRSQAAEAA